MICDNKPIIGNRGCTSASVIKVIQTHEIVGDGTPDNPTRHVLKHWPMDGAIIAEIAAIKAAIIVTVIS